MAKHDDGPAQGGSHDSSTSSSGGDSTALQRVAAITQQLARVTSTTVATAASAATPSLPSLTGGGAPTAARKHQQRREWASLPAYRELKSEGGHPGCAWDVWGRGYDQLGTVNLLTDAVVARSAQEEIKTGHTVSLNLPLHLPLQPFFGRQGLEHTFIPSQAPRWKAHRASVAQRHRERGRALVTVGGGADGSGASASVSGDGQGAAAPAQPQYIAVSDEVIRTNTQAGTQWDGLRHFGHLSLDCFYNGVPRAEIHDAMLRHNALQAAGSSTSTSSGSGALLPPATNAAGRPHNPALEAANAPALKLGVQNWASHGISGRACLIDVWGYLSRRDADRQRRGHHKVGYRFGPYDPCATHEVTLDDVREAAAAQGVRFRQGDILLLRLGFTARYYASKPSERARWAAAGADPHAGGHTFAGLEPRRRMAAWLWDNHFAAVASDSPTLEAWPPRKGYTTLHEQLLALFGMPIGEMFDLEALTEHCIKTRRWTFFFCSAPHNLHGGVASPANATAFF